MIGSTKFSKLGLLGPVDDIKAQIQGYVAEFIAARAKLQEMTHSPNLTIGQKATELLSRQDILEPQLQSTLALIDKIQTDTYSMSDIASAGAFAYEMMTHISDVNDLWSEYQGLGSSAKPPVNWLLYAAIGIGVLWIATRKRG